MSIRLYQYIVFLWLFGIWKQNNWIRKQKDFFFSWMIIFTPIDTNERRTIFASSAKSRLDEKLAQWQRGYQMITPRRVRNSTLFNPFFGLQREILKVHNTYKDVPLPRFVIWMNVVEKIAVCLEQWVQMHGIQNSTRSSTKLEYHWYLKFQARPWLLDF